jgi:hypothetical protein
MKLIRSLLLASLIATSWTTGIAQVKTPGTLHADYERVMRISGSLDAYSPTYESAVEYLNNADMDSTQNRLQLSNAILKTSYLSAYGRSMNDGALWYGRGFTHELHAGFQLSRGILDVTVQPVVFYSQNRGFDLQRNPIFELEYEKSPYSYQYDALIDYVVRYGDSPFAKVHPGQSDISLRLKNFRTGISTQNMSTGPSWYNPILLSTNAPGFPHLYIQTRQPLSIPYFDLGFKQVWGALYESAYFDQNPDNDWRYFAGLFVELNPHFAPGLQLGFNRTFVQRGQDFTLLSGDPFVTLYRFKAKPELEDVNLELNDTFDQIASVTARWRFPQNGFEAYVEFALNDFGGSFFGSHPDHSRAYNIGVTQIIPSEDASTYALTFELTNTAMSKTGFVRPPGSYYIHMSIEQGYSNGGQILGSGMGPGGALGYNLFFRRYTDSALHGVHIEYKRIDEDFYFLYFDDKDRHDFELGATYRAVLAMSGYNLGLDIGYARRKNMNMVPGNNQNQFTVGMSIQLKSGR